MSRLICIALFFLAFSCSQASAAPRLDPFDSQPVLAPSEVPDAYYPDRYRPAVFESAPFGGDNRLHVEINQADSQANRPPAFSSTFYNTQGRAFLTPGAVTAQIDIYVAPDWATSRRRADLWAVGIDNTAAVSKYPTFGITSEGILRFRVFDDSIGWVDLNHPIAVGNWYRLTISLTCTAVQYRVNNVLVYSDPVLRGTVSFRSSIIQGYNWGDPTYDLYFDNYRTDTLDNGCFCVPGDDDDGDGTPNATESSNSFCVDSDLDGVPDYLDLDSENDGIPDSVECGQAVCPDTDGDGTADYLDLDSDNDGLLDITEGGGASYDTNFDGLIDGFTDLNSDGLDDRLFSSPLPIPDSDGDGTPDFRQVGFVLQNLFYFVWNGFLDQSNLAVFFNKLDSGTATVTIEILDINGFVRSSQSFDLGPKQEFDFPLEILEGFAENEYGLARVTFSPPGAIDGHTALYKFGVDEVQYELIREHQNSIFGSSFASWNTNQPSRNPSQLGNVVLNWLQLSNHHMTVGKWFTVRRYLGVGALFSTLRVYIPPQGRRDIAAGHEDLVLGRSGTVHVIPDDPTSPYGGELFRYGGDSPVGLFPSTFSFGLADKLEQGFSVPQFVSVSRGAGGVNYLELSNLTEEDQTIHVTVDSNFGERLLDADYDFDSMQQAHFDMNEVLRPGEAGYARIFSTSNSPVLVKSTVYFFKPDGSVSDAYNAPGKLLVSGEVFSSYNVFLEQLNWLKVFNTSAGEVEVDVDAYSYLGVLLGTRTFKVPANSGRDYELKGHLNLPLGSDQYGALVLRSRPSGVLAADVVRIRSSQNGDSIDLGKIFAFR